VQVQDVREGFLEEVVAVSAGTRDDWILWGAVGCALVGTAHSEWSLAVAVGAHPWVATVVPGALDLYVVRALRMHRDVFLAVLAMVAANVSWYLVHAGDLPMGWPLRSAVGAVAPLVLWRVHSLKYTRNRAELLEGLPAGAVSAPEKYTAPETAPVYSGALRDPGFDPSACTHGGFCRDANGVQCIPCPEPEPDECAPEYVPADWSADPVPYLRAVPDPAPAFDSVSAVHSFPDVVHLKPSALQPGDEVHLPGAQEYLDNCALIDAEPSVRGMKNALKVGQTRADRLLKHLQHEEEL